MKLTLPLTFAVLLSGSLACAQSSTTTVSASASGGDISGTISVYYDQSCVDIYYESNLSLDIDGFSFYEVGPQFDSIELGNLIFGPGTYYVTAYFDGFDGQYSDGTPCNIADSDGGTSVTISGPVTSAITLVGPGKEVREGLALSLTVNVTAADLYNIGPTPTGTAIIFYGSTVLASKTLQPNSDSNSITGSAAFTFPTSGIAPGNYSLSAGYGGDSNLSSSSSSAITVIITQPKVSSTTSLGITPSTVPEGNKVTFAATVTPNTPGITPTGMVNFLVGTTSIGTAKLNSSAVATLTENTTGIAPGVYPVHANYGGDAYDYSSVSSVENVTVQAVTATTLTANPTTVNEGASTTLTATVNRTESAGTPTGNISFQFAGYTFATVAVNKSGVAATQFSTKNLQSGAYPVTTVYNGDTLDATSTSPAVTITVQ